LIGIGDVARFAVDAIRAIDFQFFGAVFVERHLVDGSGTKILARVAVLADAAVAADIRIEYVQVAGLIFVVPRAGMIDVGEAVEGEFAVAFEPRRLIDERIGAMQLLVVEVAGLGVHRIHKAAAPADKLKAGKKKAFPKAIVKRLMKIPDFPQFIAEPALIDFAFVRR
jgi:hypothetical protein